MVVVEWKIRDYEDPVDEQEAYINMMNPVFIEDSSWWLFTEPSGRCYTNGTFNYVDFVDADLFLVIELQEMLKTLGYKNKKNKMYYHFKIPNNNLDHGLQALGNDADVMNLVRYIDKYRLIEVFIEHEYIVLETYFKSPQKLRLEEIDDVESSALARKPFKKPGLKVNRLPQLLLEGPSLNDDVEVPSFNAEKEKETTDCAVSESNEEDVNEDENGSESNEEAANEDKTCSESDDSEDSDYIVDEDNVINEVYVEEGFDLDVFDMDIDCDSDVESKATTLVSCQAMATRRKLYVWKNDKLRVRAMCRRKCPNSVGPNASGLNSPNKGKLKQVNGKWVKSKTVETCLGDDLDLNPMSNFTFISDRQKGILPAIAQVFPNAEHRFCVRHIYENFKAQWKGNQFKELVWKCAAATTVPYFDKQMGKLKNLDEGAYEYLQKIPPQHWSRSHFSGRAHCDVLLNNLCEVFNRQLLDGRDVPIITCLEFVREYLMKRIVNVKKVISKSPGPLTPAATKLFEAIKHKATFYTVLWNGGTKYQVSGPYEDQCVVDMEEKNCSCRKWELTGMPCKHAVAVINEMTITNVDVGVPESWVHSSYWVSTWAKQYSYTINPINGRNLWSKHPSPYTIIPPKIHPQIGRPPKSRKKSAGEISSQKMSVNGKLSRVGKSVTCGKCGMKGHNRTSCKGIVGGSQASKVGGSQASKVGGSQASSVGGSKASSVRGSKASSVGVSKRTRGSQTGTSSAAKRSKLF
ncbi:mutator type transposase [Tanacetum coccineum]